MARQTWATQGWQESPVVDRIGRQFVDDKSRVPYIKDIINTACYRKADEDIIVLTNADICCAPLCSQQIAAGLMFTDAVCCSRRDFRVIDKPFRQEDMQYGVHYPGLDLFAFRVRWWIKHNTEYPDLLMGREIWDLIMFCLMERTNPPTEVRLWDLIYHEFHYQFWADPKHKNRLRSQLHNVSLGQAWLRERNIDISRFGFHNWV